MAQQLGKSIAKYKPFVCALKTNQKSIRCDFCFKSIKESIECESCRRHWYCSQFCRNNDLITHSFECNPIYDLSKIIADMCSAPEVRDESDWAKFKDPDEFVTQTLLLLRILFRLKSDSNCAQKTYELGNGMTVSYDDIIDPKCHQMHKVWDEEEDTDGLKEGLIDEVSYNFGAWLRVVKRLLALDFIKSKFGSVSEDVLMRAFRIVVRYTLYVCDTTFLNEIGKAIYVEMCFLSHSCVPNCGPLFDGNNALNLRLLDNRVTDFSQLRYDFQIEMTGYSGPELANSLFVRNIDCNCKKCSKLKLFSQNLHKELTYANLKYGNWPTLDYCQAMTGPINETLHHFTEMYGQYHPWITALLLWKFRIESFLFKFEDISKEDLFGTYLRLKDALCVTHGSNHVWTEHLISIEPQFKQFMESNDNLTHFQVIAKTIEQLIPQSIIDQKLA